MASLARDVYRQFYDLAPGLLPDPSDLAFWRATGTDTGAVLLEITYYETYDPLKVTTVRHYL
jgi:hypothetical protein